MSAKIAVVIVLLLLFGGIVYNQRFIRQNIKTQEASSSASLNPSVIPTTQPSSTPVPIVNTPPKKPSNALITNTETGKVNVSIETIYYSINGSSENEIKSQLNQLGPEDQYGRRGDAYTAWYLKWNYPRLLSEGRCTTGPVTVSLEVKYTLPKLESLLNISSDLKTKWEKFTQNLVIHEEGHKNFAVEQANELLKQLNKVGAFEDCSQLDLAANTIGERVLNTIRDHDKQYDQETDHGATQGARFP